MVWERPRRPHHSTRPTLARHFLEMVAAMWVGMVVGGLVFAPVLGALGMTPTGVFVLCMFWIGVTDGPACGLYCGLMIPAMLAVVLSRRADTRRAIELTVERDPSPAGTGRCSLRDGKALG